MIRYGTRYLPTCTWAVSVPRGAAPQKPTELPRPRLPTEPVGRSALSRHGDLFTHIQWQFQRAAGADSEGETGEISHFSLKKSPAARFDVTAHQWGMHACLQHEATVPAKWGIQDDFGLICND